MLGLSVGRHPARRPAGARSGRWRFVAVPGMLILAAVGSHFAVFFPRLDPALDKVFGSLMLWFYGFALIGALWKARNA